MKKAIILTLAVLSIVGLYTTAQTRNGLVLTDTQAAIDYMYANGLTIFSTESTFMANQSLRRDEAAAFFARFARDVLGMVPDTSKAECNAFTDLSQGHHDLQGEMRAACQLGLMRGSAGKFMPAAAFSNAHALTVIVRLLDGNQSETGAHWASNYLLRARALGLTSGLSADNSNNLDKFISRGDVAKLIEAGAMQRGGNTIPQEYFNPITKKYQGDGFSFDYPNDGIISIIDSRFVRITNFISNDLGFYLPSAGNFIISIQSFPVSMYDSCFPMMGLNTNGEPMEYEASDFLRSTEIINGVTVYTSIPEGSSSTTTQGRICIEFQDSGIQSITYGIRGGEINIESIIINSLQIN